MNKIGFYLKHSKRQSSSIDMVTRISGKLIKVATNISTETAYWNIKKQRANTPREYNDGYHVNNLIERFDVASRDVLQSFQLKGITPARKELSIAIHAYLKPNNSTSSEGCLVDFFTRFRNDCNWSYNTKKRYLTTINLLITYEAFLKTRLTWETIDMKFYKSFQKWMFSKKIVENVEVEGYSLNTFGDTIKNIKMIFAAAKEEGLHNYSLPVKFITVSENSDSIYLSIDELTQLHDLNIGIDLILDKYPATILNVKGNVDRMITALSNARDMFLIGCFTALRFSDYSQLRGMKHTDAYISRTSQKTGTRTMIPMHSIIREILKRRNNVLPPAISNQKLNTQLKHLCEFAGITESVEVTITKGGKKSRSVHRKCDLVTTHTARRSGATNMLLAGIDPITIMSFTGHKTTKSFMAYVRASQEQLASKAAEHPYFN